MRITFNSPYITGKETDYIISAVESGHISGNGMYTKACQKFFEQRYGIKKSLLTTSCTDALEMCAMLINIAPGDEVIIPSFTFVSTALAFVRQGAEIVFADSNEDHPNIDVSKLEGLITSKTKAIVVVHYAGVACEMERVMALAQHYNLVVIEDAAQAVESTYKGKPLGTIGHLGAFSFHETKNVQCGEGGLLAINDDRYVDRAEIIWEKGTNRTQFFRGEIKKYEWVDTGSSFLPSELNAAFLYAQLENIERIQSQRIKHWNRYYDKLKSLSGPTTFRIEEIPDYATLNAHMFYIVCKSHEDREKLLESFRSGGIRATSHYQSLHQSAYYTAHSKIQFNLPNCVLYTECIVRLPMYYSLTEEDQDQVIEIVEEFYRS